MGSWAFPSFLSLTPDLGVSKGSSEPFFVLFQVRVSRVRGGRSLQRSPTTRIFRFSLQRSPTDQKFLRKSTIFVDKLKKIWYTNFVKEKKYEKQRRITMIERDKLQFNKFLAAVAETDFETNTTATGTVTIQQSARNKLRREGVEALKHDLELMYGEDFDILETKEGIVIAAENDPGEFTFSWELKSTIKSIDYDPFIEANNYDEEVANKAEKKLRKEQEKAQKIAALEEKRAKKLAEIERRKELTE